MDRTAFISLPGKGKPTRSYNNNRYQGTTNKVILELITTKLIEKEGDRARLSKQGDSWTGMKESITGLSTRGQLLSGDKLDH